MGRDAVVGPWVRALRDPVALAYLAAVVLGLTQAAVLNEPERTLPATAPYLLAWLVAIAVRLVGPRDGRGLEWWVQGLTVAGAVLSVWLLATFLTALPEGVGQEHGFYRIKVSVTSPVGDHNTAAGLLLPAVVAAAACAARDRRWVVALGVTTLGLVATLSRGAVLVLLVLALLAARIASERGLKRALLTSAVAATGLLVGLTLLLDTSPPGVDLPEHGHLGASVLGRIDLAERGVELGLANPLLGVGLGGFAQQADDLPPPNDHAHQLLAHAGAEGGVVLLLVAVAVPVLLAVRVLRLPAGRGRDVLLLGGLGLVAHAQVEILGGRPGYEVLVAMLASLAVVRAEAHRISADGSGA